MASIENIDVMKIQEDLKNNMSFRKFISKPSVLGNVALVTSFQSLSVFSDNLIIDFLLVFFSGFKVASIIRDWELYKDVNHNLTKILEETEVYKRLSNNYNSFVSEVAKFAKQFDLHNAKEVILFFELMMNMGYFSESKSHIYHKYNYFCPETYKLLGANVMTGASVCRHMTSLFYDLLDKMDIKSCYLVVRPEYESEMNEFFDLNDREKKYNHSVLGVIEDDSKFIYDPTHLTFAGKVSSDNEKFLKNNMAVGILNDKELYYSLSKLNMNSFFGKVYRNNLSLYNKLELEQIDFEVMNLIRLKFIDEYIKNIDLFEKFYVDFSVLLKDISNDVKQLMPKSDEEIKEWVLKY